MKSVYFWFVMGLLFLGVAVVCAVWSATASYRRLGEGTPRQRNAAGFEFGCSVTILTIIATIAILVIALSIVDG